jgi:hypothetical protein
MERNPMKNSYISTTAALLTVLMSTGAVFALDASRDKLLWHNRSTGELSAWEFNSSGDVSGKIPLSWKCDSASGCSGSWTALGTGDLNGDGATDVLWYNKASGELSGWLTDSAGNVANKQAISWKCDAASGCASDWSFAGIGDFNGDNAADVLWHNKKSGELSAWLVGTSGEVSDKQNLSWKCDAASGCTNDWKLAGVGDFNSDGTSDVLWHNRNTGELSVWMVGAGGEVTGKQSLSWKCNAKSGCAGGWRVIDIADFNQDGTTDVLWFDKNSGTLSAWLLASGGKVTDKQDLSWKCDTASGCQNDWRAVGGL